MAYESFNCNFQILRGNSDTSTVESHRLMPPIFANRVRILPYSVHRRTVCLRLELLGCLYEGKSVNYSCSVSQWVPLLIMDKLSNGPPRHNPRTQLCNRRCNLTSRPVLPLTLINRDLHYIITGHLHAARQFLNATRVGQWHGIASYTNIRILLGPSQLDAADRVKIRLAR